MRIGEVLQVAYRGSHEAVAEAMDEIDPAMLFWQPDPGASHAGFLLWHLVRDEDVIVHGEILGGPQVWARGRWFERFGLPREGQGTGYTPASLASVQYDLADMRAYATEVWRATGAALAALPDSALLRPAASGSTLDLILTGSVGHNWVHLGEIRALMGRRGWRFRE